MNKILKKAITLAMAAAITAPVGMGTGIASDFEVITAHAAVEFMNLSITSFTANSITISWQEYKDANNYEISYYQEYEGDANYKVAGQTANTTYTISGLQSGCCYHIRVIASNATGKIQEGFCNGVTKVAKIKGLKQDSWVQFANSASAAVSWEKQWGADGYQYKLLDPVGKVKKKGKITSTVLGLSVKKNNIYQFMIRPYQIIDGKTYYGTWKTIQVFGQPWVKSVTIKKNKKSVNQLKISWYKQKGATGYDIYVSKTNKSKNYKKVKSVGKNKTSITLSKFKKKKIKGTYYVYVVSKIKTSQGTSKSGITYMWQTGKSGEGYVL